ncbi:type I-E CRISPR-associated protein Cas5/CasD [Sandaracinobacter neustonicus]|uniref:Type I-E CRISPR-associated protein Cas5/CasD n=1 Tax=Sandaracinobacter neustonicus TaxID=1715348 RepID=A0A501XXL1_9SPHN|nr:type I-E CRISPR-associated protein Cas5/CasD [Sandaracinobacter neustonicus]TPE64797.1 type I-E CRISPR-associated protein Cas5/CasD [Sandaracinobacter neustonicus]
MPDYLTFTLTAGMAAMGDFAGHERRGTWHWPGRSAVLGLMAAAMGIRRTDIAGLKRLEGLRLAVAVYESGVPLRDFHTVQTVPTAKMKQPQTRAEALSIPREDLNTVLTLRDYRVGVAYAVALWRGDATAPGLQELADALRTPAFTLYLGRKSCPLSAPPGPAILSATGAAQALASHPLPPFWGQRPTIRFIASDERLAEEDHEEQRQDQATDRAAWHFTGRRLFIHHPLAEDA